MSTIEKKHYDEDDVIRSQGGVGREFGEIVVQRVTRRDVLKFGAIAGLMLAGGSTVAKAFGQQPGSPTGLNFTPINPTDVDAIVVAPNYNTQTVVRWGDPLKPGMGAFKVEDLDADYQKDAFGYNCDFVGFMPVPFGSGKSDHGLLAVNHEYVNPELMFPIKSEADVNMDQARASMEAVGFGVVEIKRIAGKWEIIRESKLNKRWTATSELKVSGPAAGSDRMKTSKHKDGKTATGTMSNCAAGKTPWGTVLSAEENFQDMFVGAQNYTLDQDVRSAKRYGIGTTESSYGWDKHFDRFDVAKEPNEPNHFGWVVEIDPYDPDWTPVKRTALGRFRHEAATSHVTKNERVVLYSGDDARFEYVYKFVCAKPFNKEDRKANRGILDEGTLFVAKFNEDGTGEWLPLVFGTGPLTADNGFRNQGDVVIDARIAADLLGATKMDRPEDIEVNPVNQKVYVVCTNNTDRGKDGKAAADAVNPRDENRHGHIIEITEDEDDHAATKFLWELFLVCGDPENEETYYAGFPKDQVSRISCPDNICFDAKGNLWIATDGAERAMNIRDGFYAVPTDGPERGKLMQFMASVAGSEVCGPEFTPDGKTAFLAIQHPGEGSTYAKPSTRWPDGVGVPRPSIIAIEAKNGDVIGSKGA